MPARRPPTSNGGGNHDDRRRTKQRVELPPPVGARTPGLDELEDSDTDEWNEEWDEPNYLVRRALAIGTGVVAVAVLAVVVSRLIGDDDAGSSSTTPNAEWNTVVVLTDDEIRLLDPDTGDEFDTFDAPDDLLDAQSIVAGNILVTLTDEGRIVQTDLTDGSQERSRAGQDESLLRSRADSTTAIVGPDAGGDVTIVDTDTRTSLSIGAIADLDDPLIFASDVRINRQGTHAAASDARSFQSIVVDIAEQEAELLAGQTVAIGDDRVVTAQRAGADTELEFYDLDGDRLGAVDVRTPAASMLTPSGEMVLVDDVGVIRMANADGNVSEVGAVAAPGATVGDAIEIAGGSVVLGGTRLVASTGQRVFVIDESGRQIGTAAGQVTNSPTFDSRCITVGSPRSSGTSVQLDLDTGRTIAEIGGGIVATTSVDGCAAALVGGDRPQLLVDGEIIDVDADSIIDVAPDGSAYVVADGRDSELIALDGEDVIEVADRPAVIRFAQR